MTEPRGKLDLFVGKWKGTAEVASTPYNSNGGVNASTIVGRAALEGEFVFVDEVMEQVGFVTFRSHRVFGYDPNKEVVTLHFFDSDGANPPTRAEGSWEDAILTLAQQTPFGFVRYVYEFDQGSHLHRTEVSEDGKEWSVFIRAEYRRLKD